MPTQTDLGIVDALVKGSFLIQLMLGEIAAEHDLSITQMRMLGVLRDRKPQMSELARIMSLSKPSATGLVDRAERRGLVLRSEVPEGDGRATRVALTEEGHRQAQALFRKAGERVSTLVGDLSETNRLRLSRVLSQVVMRDADQRGIDLDPTSARPR